MAELVAVKGNSVLTGHATCTISTTTDICSTSVFVGGIGVCHKTDAITEHTQPVGDSCVNHTPTITAGSSTVFADGKAIARNKDAADAGSISSGNAANVFAG